MSGGKIRRHSPVSVLVLAGLTVGLFAGTASALPKWPGGYGIPASGSGNSQGVMANNMRPAQLVGVGIDEHLDRPVDLEMEFVGENGYPVKLKEFFHQGRPVVLDLVYYNCPMLCTLVLNGQTETMREVPGMPGKDFEVVTITIDPNETFADAKKKKEIYLASYERPAPGWHFLADKDGNVKKLAEQVGFHYRFDPQIQQFAHPAAIMILTPEGKMARYLYGVKFKPRDFKFALQEASEGRSTNALEKILLFCYHYDPKVGGYVIFATRMMRIGGVLSAAAILGYLFFMFRGERRRGWGLGSGPGSGPTPGASAA
jgi:protein SCO1/2